MDAAPFAQHPSTCLGKSAGWVSMTSTSSTLLRMSLILERVRDGDRVHGGRVESIGYRRSIPGLPSGHEGGLSRRQGISKERCGLRGSDQVRRMGALALHIPPEPHHLALHRPRMEWGHTPHPSSVFRHPTTSPVPGVVPKKAQSSRSGVAASTLASLQIRDTLNHYCSSYRLRRM